jgi:hypothetical protein
MMIEVGWRVLFIDFIKDQKLPPGIDERSAKAARVIRRSKGYVLVGNKPYKKFCKKFMKEYVAIMQR